MIARPSTAPVTRTPRTRWAAAGVVGAVATAVCAAGVTAASAGGPTHTFRIAATQTSDTILNGVDVATDQDRQNGKTTGYDVTSCLVDTTTHLANCDVALARSGGVLYGHSTVDVRTGRGSGRITGGLRSFSGAHGTISVTPGPSPDVSMITISYRV
jgi:hypothetical protein